MRSPLRRVALVALTAALTMAVGAPAALAHVTVSSANAVQGGYGIISFTVPSESKAATTTKVTVKFPVDTPLSSARVQPVPGWTAAVTTQTLATPVTIAGREITQAIDTIVWTTAGSGLAPSEYQVFSVSGGPLPESDTMVFKAIQTYSDGTEVSWVEQAAAGSTTEPEHPAPTLKLAKAAESGASAPASGGADTGVTVNATGESSRSTRGLSAAALIVAILALVAAFALPWLLLRRPRAE